MSNQRALIDENIALGGGSATIVDASTSDIDSHVKVVGGYIRQTAGVDRNFVIEVYDGTNARPVSDNDSEAKNLDGQIILAQSDVLRITAEAAADQATYEGVISYEAV